MIDLLRGDLRLRVYKLIYDSLFPRRFWDRRAGWLNKNLCGPPAFRRARTLRLFSSLGLKGVQHD